MRATLRFARLAALPLALATSACDNPVGEADHVEAMVVLNASGVEVARHTSGDETSTGILSVAVDVAQTFTVQGLGEDGDVVEIDGEVFAIQLEDMRPGWTAVLSGSNQVVVTATAAGPASLGINLFHEGHLEIDPTFQVVAQ